MLIATFQLGHQPVHVASPAASAAAEPGTRSAVWTFGVKPWDPGTLQWAQAVGFSVPMHAAMRLAPHRQAPSPAASSPALAMCFCGLYATVSRELIEGQLFGRGIAGDPGPR